MYREIALFFLFLWRDHVRKRGCNEKGEKLPNASLLFFVMNVGVFNDGGGMIFVAKIKKRFSCWCQLNEHSRHDAIQQAEFHRPSSSLIILFFASSTICEKDRD